MKEYSKQYLEDLINNQVEENIQLEYKSSEALHNSPQKKKEISKDVSAMANSAGGKIIYGLKEFDEKSKRHLPKKITPILRENISKEWLEQVINSNIQPKISGLLITPINISNNEVVFVVIIPQSNTVHQALDKRYYKRYNFESVAMENYEIKDILNRQRHPDIIIEFEIERTTYEKSKHPLTIPNSFTDLNAKKEMITDTLINIYFKNVGKVFAKYINGYVFLPYNICKEKKHINEENTTRMNDETYIKHYCENTIRDVVDVFGGRVKYGSSRYDPLLPGLRLKSKSILLINENYPSIDKTIYWELNADNAEIKKGSISTKNISFSIRS